MKQIEYKIMEDNMLFEEEVKRLTPLVFQEDIFNPIDALGEDQKIRIKELGKYLNESFF